MNGFFLVGGFLGFAVTFLGNVASGRDINGALRDGMIGCLIMAYVFNFLGRQIEHGLLEILRKEQAAEDEEEGVDEP